MSSVSLLNLVIDTIVKNISHYSNPEHETVLTNPQNTYITTPFAGIDPVLIPEIIARLSEKKLLNLPNLALFLVHDLHTLTLPPPLCSTLITNPVVNLISVRSKHLKRLRLPNAKNISATGISYLASNLTPDCLEEFELSNCYKIAEDPFVDFFSRQTKLKDVRLCNIGLSGKTLKALCKSTGLERLDISNWSDLDANSVDLLASSCPGLISLQISNTWDLDSSKLRYLSKLSNLQTLDLQVTQAGDTSMRDILASNTSLKSLNLTACEPIGAGTIIALGRHCLSLQELDLSGCLGIPTAAFIPLGSLKNLKKLILSGTNIRDMDVYDIFNEGNGPKQLSRLQLDETSLTNAALACLVANLPREHLKYFSLSRNKEVNDLAMEPFVEHFNRLIVLDISSCRELRNGTIVKVVNNLGGTLQVLDCSGNVNFTRAAFQECIVGLPELLSLSMRGCARVSLADCQSLATLVKSQRKKMELAWS